MDHFHQSHLLQHLLPWEQKGPLYSITDSSYDHISRLLFNNKAPEQSHTLPISTSHPPWNPLPSGSVLTTAAKSKGQFSTLTLHTFRAAFDRIQPSFPLFPSLSLQMCFLPHQQPPLLDQPHFYQPQCLGWPGSESLNTPFSTHTILGPLSNTGALNIFIKVTHICIFCHNLFSVRLR